MEAYPPSPFVTSHSLANGSDARTMLDRGRLSRTVGEVDMLFDHTRVADIKGQKNLARRFSSRASIEKVPAPRASERQ